MASNFNNSDTHASPTDSPTGRADTPDDDVANTPDAPLSDALTRFRACRWMQPAEDSSPEFCTHREVKPYAGSSAFDAEAWCPDCTFYKLRRVPKKRSPDDYRY
ncbi:MAG: hypothetical protein O2930_02295 [Acidobacteria bacterium]|nr:hypothetical protein [Acidobacteriota bacterium]